MTNQEYRISEHEANKILGRLRIVLPLTGLLASIIPLAIIYLRSGELTQSGISLYLPIAVILISTIPLTLRTLKVNSEYLKSYTLTLTDNAIVINVARQPERGIEFAKVASITESTDGTIIVVSRSGKTNISVHKHIEGRQELIEALNKIRPVMPTPKKRLENVLRMVAILTFFACGAVSNISEDEQTITICGYIITAIVAGACIYTLISRTARQLYKKIALVALFLLLANIVFLYLVNHR